MSLHVRPLDLATANELVSRWHRHHKPCVGHRFSIGVYDELGECHGAAIVGRPVARVLDEDRIAEVSRLVTDGTRNACSCLYGAAARAAAALGFEEIRTYTLPEEGGASLRGAGWVLDGETEGDGSKWANRGRTIELFAVKNRWIKRLNRWTS